jgi:hypothetical protein
VRGAGRSNCETLVGVSAIPSDTYIRLMLDGAPPAASDGLFLQSIAAAGPPTPFRRLDGRRLIALDGCEHSCSRRIQCRQRSARLRADGGTEHFHNFLGASLVAPGHAQVLPLPPEFITTQDGAEKQDCERNAAKRWLARHGPTLATLPPVCLGDDLFACQPIGQAIHAAGGNFILTCKPASHRTINEIGGDGRPGCFWASPKGLAGNNRTGSVDFSVPFQGTVEAASSGYWRTSPKGPAPGRLLGRPWSEGSGNIDLLALA